MKSGHLRDSNDFESVDMFPQTERVKPRIETIGLLSFGPFREVETPGLLSNGTVTVVSMSELKKEKMDEH